MSIGTAVSAPSRFSVDPVTRTRRYGDAGIDGTRSSTQAEAHLASYFVARWVQPRSTRGTDAAGLGQIDLAGRRLGHLDARHLAIHDDPPTLARDITTSALIFALRSGSRYPRRKGFRPTLRQAWPSPIRRSIFQT